MKIFPVIKYSKLLLILWCLLTANGLMAQKIDCTECSCKPLPLTYVYKKLGINRNNHLKKTKRDFMNDAYTTVKYPVKSFTGFLESIFYSRKDTNVVGLKVYIGCTKNWQSGSTKNKYDNSYNGTLRLIYKPNYCNRNGDTINMPGRNYIWNNVGQNFQGIDSDVAKVLVANYVNGFKANYLDIINYEEGKPLVGGDTKSIFYDRERMMDLDSELTNCQKKRVKKIRVSFTAIQGINKIGNQRDGLEPQKIADSGYFNRLIIQFAMLRKGIFRDRNATIDDNIEVRNQRENHRRPQKLLGPDDVGFDTGQLSPPGAENENF